MGQRISYFKNNFNKGLKELLMDNYSSFRQWYLDANKSSMEEFNEPLGNEKLITYLRKGTKFVTDFDNLDKKLIDELTSEFIGFFSQKETDGDILESFGPSIGVASYLQSYEIILATKDFDFIRLWNYIIKGRSLKDKGDFNNYTNEYKIGFLERQEIEILKLKTEYYFGNLENLKKKNGFLAIEDQKSAGLKYLMLAIEELTDNNKELIIAID